MTASAETVPASSEEDQYQQLLSNVRNRFAGAVASKPALFTADTPRLFDVFLDALPEDRRQHYTCHACQRFVNTYGGIVTILPDGSTSPVMWDPDAAPPFFRASVRAVARAVTRAKVDGVFLSSEKSWGLPQNKSEKAPFLWKHMAVTPEPALVFRKTVLQSADQKAAERREEYGMLNRGLAEFPIETVRQAHTLLTTGQLYRSEKCIGVAKWLLALHEAIETNKGRRDNLTWLAAATAPAGFCHVRSGMIGTLMEDIAARLPFADIKRRFDDKMAPSNYQRAQTGPSAGQIAQAEKVVAELQAAGALERRYATAADLQFLWQPTVAKAEKAAASGVFAHLTPKSKATAPAALAVPARTMTWEKFARTVLPSAVSVEVQVPATCDRFAALVTAANKDAPPILQWDAEDARNPVSWYYAAGIDAEIKRRVLGAGGMHGETDIRASLIWNNRNDLDLHVVTPRREEIYYGHKRSVCGGWLDVDMNVRGETDTPVENIRWAKGAARAGRYRVSVQNYRFHEFARTPTPFRVELEINGEVFHFDGVASPRMQIGGASDVIVAEFDYQPGQKLATAPTGRRAQVTSDAQSWNIAAGQWSKVTGVVESPNLWGSKPATQHGRHTFFLLDGCKDTAQGAGRGFFVETLRAEFRPIRSTLEAFTANATIADGDGPPACGIGMTDQSPWDLTLRVTTATGVSTYHIDRWD